MCHLDLYFELQYAQQRHSALIEEMDQENLMARLNEENKPNQLELWLSEQIIRFGQKLKIHANHCMSSDRFHPVVHGIANR